ncbi:MAG: [FeFe] hydrogenase H-cluster radical SAM maturase HydE [Gammaproteobacteria bacterium RBG_16_37_9]|nr:MAG: [FeFe] hydrogenase H-cluster radical SAM maturase HydE [Gammaproteobacteria bacterium RBG_16_37_9]
MCYAIPAKLVAIDGQTGTIDYFGEKRQILLDLDDVAVGDYVYAQGGVLVRKIPPKEAEEILEHWQTIFFELKKTDAALSKIDQNKLSSNALAVLQKVNLRKSLTPDEMLSLFNLQDEQELKVLYEIANNVRQREHGNSSCIHGVIEFSNYCSNNCHYCGIRKDQELPRYRMSIEEIISAAKEAVDEYGFKALVLQSGEDFWYDDAKLITMVREIRKMGVLVFVSLGLRSKGTYQKLYDAGARAVLLRFETSNKDIFAKLRPGTNLADRVQLIKALKAMGYVLATGFIVGFPGETNNDLIQNILLAKYLAPDMYSFGPLIPASNTPLFGSPKVSKDLILKTIAVMRFIDSNSNILVTTALETLDRNAKQEALLAGANSMMINITPKHYKELYKIYDDKADVTKEIKQSIQETVKMLYELGRAPTDIAAHAVKTRPSGQARG